MNDIGLQTAQQAFDFRVGFGISQRPNGTQKFRNLDHIQIRIAIFLEQAALSPEAWTCDESHIICVISDQIQAVEAGILLSPANDHPGNDVYDSHIKRIAAVRSVFFPHGESNNYPLDRIH
jgi:hypothetical protein